MKLIYTFKKCWPITLLDYCKFRNSNNKNLFVKTRVDENIVYFMLDIMITNNSIPTSSEIRGPFHAKKEQWLSHFKRVAYAGDHTLYTCEYVMMWKMSLREIYLIAMLKFLFFYMVEYSVVVDFFLIIYLFMNIWWDLRLTAWMMEYESDKPNITFCYYFHVLCHICDIYWQLLHFKTLIIVRKKFTSKSV